MSLPDDWTVAGLLRYGLATAVGLFILNVFFESNVRAFIEEHGWDKLLSDTWRKMRPLTTRRGFWFAFGLVVGGLVVAWLIPERSVATGAIGVMPIEKPPIAPQQPPAPAPADMPRVYTNKTVQGLAAFYKDRTDMQGDVFMADEKGKWINTEGKLQYLDGRGARLYNDGHTILCNFGEKWKAKLSVLRPSDFIKITGKIRQDQWLPALLLEECELRD